MIEDNIIRLEELDPAHLDRGTYFGDGVYEVVRSYNGIIFALDEHLERLNRSLFEVDIHGVDIGLIRDRIELAFSRSGIGNARIYFHITRGHEVRDHVGGSDLAPSFFLTVTELSEEPDVCSGISVSTHADWRWKRCDIKSLNLLANVLARRDAESKGCQEAILVDANGNITEGAGSSFFVINANDRELISRPLGPEILDSITRRIVIRIAGGVGLKTVERILTPTEALESDELFTAVTTRGIIPVVKFDGKIIGNGKIGRYTTLLIEAFDREVKKKTGNSHL